MPFVDHEQSRYEGEPVDLFLFRYGTEASAYFAYTDAEQEINHLGIIYSPIPIRRDAFTSSGTLDKSALNIETPITTRLADLFRIYPPGQVISLTIRQGHANDPSQEFPVIWMGRVLSCQRDARNAKFICEPFSTSMKRSGLRRHYQYGCPHVLYGGQCLADKQAATIVRQVINRTATSITLTDFWNPHPVAKYVGGMVEWAVPRGIERRSILRVVDGKVLHLSGQIVDLEAGTDVDVVLGCNHQHGINDPNGDCTNLHNNILNFGGQPWIPTKNPINTNPFS